MTSYSRKIIVLHIDTSLLRIWYTIFTHSYIKNIYCISCILYLFDWVVYNISPNVSNNVQTREIHNFTQGMFCHLMLEWGRKSVNRTKHNMTETLEHYLICQLSCWVRVYGFQPYLCLQASRWVVKVVYCCWIWISSWRTSRHSARDWVC